MKVHETNTLLSLRRVQNFLDANAPKLGTVNTSGARADLDNSVVQLTALAVAQEQSKTQSQGETSKQLTLRTAIMAGHMAPIAAIAKSKLATVPEFSSLVLPARTIHSQALITAAMAMANAASPYSTTFTGQGLPTTFVADLQAAATALQTSIDGRSAIKTTGVGATAGAAAEVRGAHNAVKVLDSMVAPQLTNDPKTLAAWNNAKRVTAKPGVALGSTQTIPPTTAATTPSGTPATAPAPGAAASTTATTEVKS